MHTLSLNIETGDLLEQVDMAENLVCNLCDNPGSFAAAEETARIRAVVREFAHEEFTVWRCRNCKSLHCKEPIDHDIYYRNYPLKSHVLDFATRCAYANRLRFMKKLGFNRKSTLLDHGCAGGAFLAYLREKNYSNVFGYDPFSKDYCDKSTLDRTYDFVTNYEVIEHTEDPAGHFADLAELIEKPTGCLVVGTPRAENIDLNDFRTYGVPLHMPHHRHILSYDSFISLGREHGLKPVSMTDRFPFDTRWPVLNWAFLKEYVYQTGGVFDVLVEKPQFSKLLTSPRLVFLAAFGYLVYSKENMIVAFKS